MTNVTVRPARREEIPILVEFQLALAQESESLTLDRQVVEQGVTAVFDEPTRGQYLIAVVRDQNGYEEVAGALLLTYEWSDWRNGCVLWLQSVYVAPRWRRQGVFRSLHRYVQERLLSQSTFIGMRLYVDTRNRTAQEVYRRLGMRGDHYQVWEWFPENARAAYLK